ncbi:MAG: amidohydrolase [Phenylobacterium sp.]|nr:amidohydrolase [Phenylobacterium sp.]
MSALNFPVYDADHHLYEPAEAFLRHLPAQYEKEFYFVDVKGRTKLVIGGMLSEYIPNPTFEVVAAPGSHEVWYRSANVEGKTMRELAGKAIRPPPEWRSGDGRLAVMDQQGIHAALVFPTLASVIEERLNHKPEVMGALFHSLNMWTDEEWGFARNDRLFSVPMISLADLDLALKELDFLLKCGARVIGIRPAPVPGPRGGRSFGFEEFDPFWARVAEAKVFVCLHASDSGYDKIARWWTGGRDEWQAFSQDAFQLTLDGLGRPVADSISAMICHGLFTRHPDLRIASVENGAGWVGPLLHRLDQAYGKMPKAFAEPPRETFRRHFFVAPFYEDDPKELSEFLPSNRILFGSDYPHPEGLAEPLDYLKEFSKFDAAEIELIFSKNLKGLLEGVRN